MRFITCTILAALALTGCAAVPKAGTTEASPPTARSGSSSADANTPVNAKADITGTCDYDLGSATGTDYSLLGEVDVHNTGNIGIRVKVSITWPQFGSNPVRAAKTVTVAYDKTVTVRFNQHATQTQIDRLQSWQMRHEGEDGCNYGGKILETSGRMR